MREDTCASVVSTSGTSGTSKTSKMLESLINKLKVCKPSESNEFSNEVMNLSPKEISVKRNSSKPIN